MSLDITGIREDGYHLINTVMQRVELSDDITVNFEEKQQNNLDIVITTNKSYLPTNEKNIAYKAALLMSHETDKKGVITIDIFKRIPVAAGLAGGSGNGAAVLIALNKLFGLNMSIRDLCALGSKLGADVPFMILTQSTKYTCALGENLGDELTVLKHGLRKYVVLSKPSFGVSTKDAYIGMDNIEIVSHPDSKKLIDYLESKDYTNLYSNMENVLELYTLTHYPETLNLKNIMSQMVDVEFTLMTGSGPTVFSVYSTLSAAKNACYKLRDMGYETYWAKAF